jgi:hypothetical protein
MTYALTTSTSCPLLTVEETGSRHSLCVSDNLVLRVDAMRYGSAPGIRSSKRMHDMMLTKLDLLDGYLDIYTELAEANPE